MYIFKKRSFLEVGVLGVPLRMRHGEVFTFTGLKMYRSMSKHDPQESRPYTISRHYREMACSGGDFSHFLHIKRSKYRKQYRNLRRLYKHDEHLVDPKQTMKDRTLFKYWRNRQLLFSKINSSQIYMTEELWFSVTPEILAIFLAKFVRACLPNAKKVMDVFCGGGGNSIQFAKLFPKVYGVDSSLEHLYCTYRNAQAYDVADRIWLKYGSWERIASKGRFSKLNIDCIFGSPPWGGPRYLKQDVYDLENALQPMGITEMLKSFSSVSQNILLFLPRNSDLTQLSRATRSVFGLGAKCRILYVKTNGFLKGIVCMWGEALVNVNEQTQKKNQELELEREQQEENFENDPVIESETKKNSSNAGPVNYEIDG